METIYQKIKKMSKDELAKFILNELLDSRNGCNFCPICSKLYQGYTADCPSDGSNEQCLKELHKYLDFKEE